MQLLSNEPIDDVPYFLAMCKCKALHFPDLEMK
jgi:hypothetical protein